jgi:broad specificity phosphatase PhoE
MKLYILRHEDRPTDCSFFTPLTEKGLENANKLVSILKELNIDIIYSSPYIRTLQTICPYASEQNINIKLEYGLAEINHPDIIAKKSTNQKLPEYIATLFNYDKSYNSIVKYNDIKYPENIQNVEQRIKQILRQILEKKENEDKNILLVTHQCVCCSIIKIIVGSKNYKKIKDIDTEKYGLGKLCLIIDNKSWIITFIN